MALLLLLYNYYNIIAALNQNKFAMKNDLLQNKPWDSIVIAPIIKCPVKS